MGQRQARDTAAGGPGGPGPGAQAHWAALNQNHVERKPEQESSLAITEASRFPLSKRDELQIIWNPLSLQFSFVR